MSVTDMYAIPKAMAFFFKWTIIEMQNLFFVVFFYLLYISVDTNSSACSHFCLLKSQLWYNLLPPKNSYLGCDFHFNICEQGHHGRKTDCGKGMLQVRGFLYSDREGGGE